MGFFSYLRLDPPPGKIFWIRACIYKSTGIPSINQFHWKASDLLSENKTYSANSAAKGESWQNRYVNTGARSQIQDTRWVDKRLVLLKRKLRLTHAWSLAAWVGEFRRDLYSGAKIFRYIPLFFPWYLRKNCNYISFNPNVPYLNVLLTNSMQNINFC